MDPLTRWLAGLVAPDTLSPTERASRLALLEGYVSIGLNGLLFAVKLSLGLATGSVALMADAVHTVADAFTSVVVVFTAYLSRRPPNPKHPFGYGRAESVSAVVIAVLLGVAAVEFGKGSVESLLEPRPLEVTWGTVAAIGVTLVVKLWMSLFAMGLGRAGGSAMLRADAWHHATDVLATIPVLVSLVGARLGYDGLDGWMGLLVALVIAYTAFDLARDAASPLIGEAPTEEEVQEIERTARSVDGVMGVHDIVVHKYGPVRVVSLHIETPHLDALAAHELAERVEHALGAGRHGEVVVHVDPVDVRHPHYREVREILERAAAEDERLARFHDIRVFGTDPKLEVTADIVVRRALDDDEQVEVQHALARRLRERFPGARLRADFEPLYAIDPRAGDGG